MRSDDDVVLDTDFAKRKIVSDKTEQRAPSHGAPRKTPPLSRAVMLLFAVASGLAVANAYFAHPMLDVMADDLGLSRAHAGLIVGATQVGYGLGLILLVPIGDLVDRRRLVIAQSLLSVMALIAIGFASSGEPRSTLRTRPYRRGRHQRDRARHSARPHDCRHAHRSLGLADGLSRFGGSDPYHRRAAQEGPAPARRRPGDNVLSAPDRLAVRAARH